MTVTLLSQIMRIDVDKILASVIPKQEYLIEASNGETMAKEAMGQIIKKETEAYILDKAKSGGLEITVDIRLGDAELPLPVGATMKGHVSSDKKEWLSQILAEEIGIPKEAQKWMD